ncbi:MAG: hypothetical protein KGH53_01300 [Candidatus Micrarchaeota archaeon]|nr:hypothetical protein [Candidatus Micrarchaeota archaeon]
MSRVVAEHPKVSVNIVLERLQSGEYLKEGKGPKFLSDFRRIDCEMGEQKALSNDLSNIKIPAGSYIGKSAWINLMVIQLLRAGRKEQEMAMDMATEKKLMLSLMRAQSL